MPDTYFLPEDYRINPVNITIDQGDEYYWDPSRVKKSRSHQFAVYKWALDIIRGHNLKTVIDVGCGFAAKLHWLHQAQPDRDYWGIDQPNAIELCKKNYTFGNWHGVNFEDNPTFPTVKADLAISSDVIEHLENPDALLDYLRQLTRPGGYILISTPERDSLRGPACKISPNPYHIREWSMQEFAAYLQSRNFKILEHRNLPALRPECSGLYLRKILRRFSGGKSLRYNQAALIQVQ